MKKLTLLFIATLFAFAFSSCDSTSSTLREMNNICRDIEKNFDKYTEDDFEKITEKFSALEKKMEQRELTDKEKKELYKLKGRYYGAFTKGAINSTKKEIKKFSEEIGSAIEGFIEEIK